MTTYLCPVSFAELRVGESEALPWCPRCATHHDRGFLRDRDDTPCPTCGHPSRTHGRRHGLTYACGLSTCGCRHQSKEKPVITEPNMTHYQLAEANQAEADNHADPVDVITDAYRSATVSALLAVADETRAQTNAIRDLTKAIKDGATANARQLSNIAGP